MSKVKSIKGKISETVCFEEFFDRETWLIGRRNGIGASETATAIGLNRFKTPIDLWEEKTGMRTPADLSSNDRVRYGTEAEEHIRALFALKNKGKYNVEYHQFRVYRNNNFPWITATLDGELTRTVDNKKGVWECKTTFIQSKSALDEWNNRIPQHYYIQVLSQMAILECEYAVLTAELQFPDGSSELRHYDLCLYDDSVAGDMQYVISETKKFWEINVLQQKKPSLQFAL